MGVGEGCYLVLPVLGPSTVRDTVGSLVCNEWWRCMAQYHC